ncbi:cysteine hydrolase [Radiobacillus kanasensis]|uniref:cysteine hydrolase family protein n=1 Tax=Radiobacillus kanasensis TaxID=2844358 RepID=UPI001E52483E|nr:cysteine hydrolase family protein [Radiobacillus kanasensis]UFU00089.1 cysteine hydrolase [Radiobacillus kanasensis]
MKQALLIIDAQQDLMEGNSEGQGVFEKKKIIDNINKVMEQATKENIAIVFIRDTDVANGEGPGFQIHQDISVPETAVIFDKAATNSFYGTPLLEHFKQNDIEHIVIMGCKTEHCVDTAVRTATIQGFDVTLVGDGHTTSNSKNLSAQQIIAHHNETLHGHYNVDNFSLVRNTDEALFHPIHNEYRDD